MERTHKLFASVCILTLLIVIPVASATIPLGTTVSRKSISVSAGEVAEFKIFFFNAYENSTIHIKMEDEAPRGWDVNIQPKEFDLEFSEIGGKPIEGYETIATPLGDVQAKPVFVRVLVPSSAEPSDYKLKISAFAGKNENRIYMQQLRTFYLEVVVNEKTESEENIGEETGTDETSENETIQIKAKEEEKIKTIEIPEVLKKIETIEGTKPTITGKAVLNTRNPVTIIIVIFTLIICLVIYKKVD